MNLIFFIYKGMFIKFDQFMIHLTCESLFYGVFIHQVFISVVYPSVHKLSHLVVYFLNI